MNCTDIIGYTHSDGYCLCVLHGTDDQGNELPDQGNETGHVYPIFACEETDSDLVCDVCLGKAIEAGTDTSVAIILEANIGGDEEEENEVCCVCGKPSEGSEVEMCDCVCPECGEDVFDDQTLTDHGMCYDCFQKQRSGLLNTEEED